MYESGAEEVSRQATVQPNNGKLEISVGYDGTWLIHGHKSHIGAKFVKLALETTFYRRLKYKYQNK